MKLPTTPLAIIVTTMLAVTSPAAITLFDTAYLANTTGSTEDSDANNATRTIGAVELSAAPLGAFNPFGADKLVVALAGDGLGNDNTVTSVTYGGQSLTKAIDAYGGNRGSSIWYMDNVAVADGSDFVITHAVSQGAVGFAAYALNGTIDGLAGISDTASTGQNTASSGYLSDMEMTVNNGDFMVLSFARNNFDDFHDGSGGRDGGTGFENTTEMYYEFLDGDTYASGYEFMTADGTFTPLVYDLTNGAGRLTAVSFLSIPEPSVALLGALGSMLLIRRKR